jgi:hypothetical protein
MELDEAEKAKAKKVQRIIYALMLAFVVVPLLVAYWLR